LPPPPSLAAAAAFDDDADCLEGRRAAAAAVDAGDDADAGLFAAGVAEAATAAAGCIDDFLPSEDSVPFGPPIDLTDADVVLVRFG